ncbi:MAG: hypothetical protein LBI96_03495, partial [Odoribacteraceae bacterium]|nr:hypothetical protein [Odoribacteraceae bacterium]
MDGSHLPGSRSTPSESRRNLQGSESTPSESRRNLHGSNRNPSRSGRNSRGRPRGRKIFRPYSVFDHTSTMDVGAK